MEDKIKELTDKIYQEGVTKANAEAEKILNDAKMKADLMIEEAVKDAEAIRSKAKSDATEISENIKEEIHHASQQSLSMLKQKISEMISLNITEKPLEEMINDRMFIINTVGHMMNQWSNNNKSQTMRLVMPDNLHEDAVNVIRHHVHEQFGQGVVVELSNKISNGFRIAPNGSNYLISFTDKDFEQFFSQFLRPKTMRILFGDDE